ncbi:MAG: sigma-70 family RNA polymerase sigma factor [Clostridia bacterium]|nr:sigma-70 family RNA polymerase sigma factor [Clostridia bacterium]
MRLETSEKEQQVLYNEALLHYTVQKWGIMPNSNDYEDIVSVGKIGLIKASITFDKTTGNAFSTYASKCINNEIWMYLKKNKKYTKNISINAPILIDEEGRETTLEDLLEDEKANPVEKITNKEQFIKVIEVVLNYLHGKNRLIMLYRIGDLTQKHVSELLNTSRSNIGMMQEKLMLRVRNAIIQGKKYKKIFHMDVLGDTYKISFISKEVPEFNKVFFSLLKNLNSIIVLPDIEIKYVGEWTIVQMPSDLTYFVFIAQIIHEIEKMNNTLEIAKMSKGKMVRDYMLSKEYCCIEELKEYFSELSSYEINNAVQWAKKKGLITSIAKGQYKRNKT